MNENQYQVPYNVNLKIPNRPLAYACLYSAMREKAQQLGYALTLHGSLNRDGDMLAVPWTDEAVSAQDLANAMLQVSGGHLREVFSTKGEHIGILDPRKKPHGRLSWSIHLEDTLYIDLGVMPLKPDPIPIPDTFFGPLEDLDDLDDFKGNI